MSSIWLMKHGGDFTMKKNRKQQPGIAGKGDYAVPRPSKTEKNQVSKREDKYAGWEETFRRDRYGR